MTINVIAKDGAGIDHHVLLKSISNRKFSKDWVSDELEALIKTTVQNNLLEVFKGIKVHSQDFKYLLFSTPLDIKKEYIESQIFMEISDDNSYQRFDLFKLKIEKPSIFSSYLEKKLWTRFLSITSQYITDTSYHQFNDALEDKYSWDEELTRCVILFNKIKDK